MDKQLTADPNLIPALVSEADAAKVQARIRDKFGFEASLPYCTALVAYTRGLDAQIAELEQRLATSPEDQEALFAHV